MASVPEERLRCPFCGGADVDRLFLAAAQVDACDCRECGARWDERWGTGEYLGRDGTRQTVNRRRR